MYMRIKRKKKKKPGLEQKTTNAKVSWIAISTHSTIKQAVLTSLGRFLMHIYVSKQIAWIQFSFHSRTAYICMPCLVRNTRNSLPLMMWFLFIFIPVCFFTSSFLYFHIFGMMYSPNHTQFKQHFPSQSIWISSSIQGAQTRQVNMC